MTGKATRSDQAIIRGDNPEMLLKVEGKSSTFPASYLLPSEVRGPYYVEDGSEMERPSLGKANYSFPTTSERSGRISSDLRL